MSPRTRDVISTKIATRLNPSKSRDERIVRTLLGCDATDVPSRLLLVSTPYVRKKTRAKLGKCKKKGRVIRGRYHGTQLGVVDVGIGTPSAALALEGIVRSFLRALVRVDFCGGLMRGHHIGDAFVAQEVIPGDGTTATYYGSDSIEAHLTLTQLLIEKARQTSSRVHEGVIWTTDTLLLQTQDLLQSWKGKGASAVDMESSIILGLSRQWKIPACSLNCISDRPLHKQGLFETNTIAPNLLTGLDEVIESGLQTLISWSEPNQ